jgi:hypothetical protein
MAGGGGGWRAGLTMESGCTKAGSAIDVSTTCPHPASAAPHRERARGAGSADLAQGEAQAGADAAESDRLACRAARAARTVSCRAPPRAQGTTYRGRRSWPAGTRRGCPCRRAGSAHGGAPSPPVIQWRAMDKGAIEGRSNARNAGGNYVGSSAVVEEAHSGQKSESHGR